MKQSIFTVLSNEALTDSVYKMVLSGDTSAITAPGQFVNIRLEGHYLRRPISVCDYDDTTLTIIYKVVGKGTGDMSAMSPGKQLDILTGLGNGYDLSLSGEKPVLMGGGVGVPPMYNLAKRLVAQGKQVQVILALIPLPKFSMKMSLLPWAAQSQLPQLTEAMVLRALSPRLWQKWTTPISTPAARSLC